MSILTEDLRAILLKILRERKGESITLNYLSKKLSIGTPALKEVLVSMGPTHQVRQTQSGRHLSYLIPTDDMLRKEQEFADKAALRAFHPLRRRTDHEAAVRRAQESKLK